MDNVRLSDVKILSGGALQSSKILIDGVDYTKKLPGIKNIGFFIDSKKNMPIVKIEFYADTVAIDAKAEVEKQCVKE